MTAADTELAVRQFNVAVTEFTKTQVPEMAVRAHRWLVLQALQRIVKKSPVRTNRFRGNWQTTIGEPATGEVSDLVARVRTPDVVRAQAAASARTMQPYATAWIVNNVPYAIRLEEGYSKQAPAGMVALTVQELRDAIVPDSATRQGS